MEGHENGKKDGRAGHAVKNPAFGRRPFGVEDLDGGDQLVEIIAMIMM